VTLERMRDGKKARTSVDAARASEV
jgi:hypothetical protein